MHHLTLFFLGLFGPAAFRLCMDPCSFLYLASFNLRFPFILDSIKSVSVSSIVYYFVDLFKKKKKTIFENENINFLSSVYDLDLEFWITCI